MSPSHATWLRNDTQIYRYCQPSEVGGLAWLVSVCIDEVSAWMKANRLQLNPVKTEVLWSASTRRQHLIPTEPVRIGNASALPATAVRDLGVYIDADITMRSHVTNTDCSCFTALRQHKQRATSFSSARFAHAGPSASDHQVGLV